MGKDARMEFLKLDALVREVVTVKTLNSPELGY
jgi:hypothetical protein